MMNDSPVLGDFPSIVKAWEGFTSETLVYASSVETGQTQTDGHISGIDGYWLELLKCGQANATMGTSITLTGTPYSTRLRLLSGFSNLSGYGHIFLNKIEFHALDSTLNDEDGIAAGQNQDVLDAIDDSAGTINDAYAQSRFLMREISLPQPNFFRPQLRGGSKTLWENLGKSAYGTQRNAGDLSMGLPLPYVYEPALPIPLGQVKKDASEPFVITAGAGQFIRTDGGLMIQRYPIHCIMEILLAP